MTSTPIEILPRGARWPWYPRYAGTATTGEPTINDQGEPTVTLTMTSKMTQGRIGLRRWLKIKAKQVRGCLTKRLR